MSNLEHKNNPITGIDLDELNTVERRQVLVVEDEMDTIFLLKQILRIAGFDVMSAVSGAEALTKLAEHRPDLVLMDLMMPEMDGFQTMNNMRQMVQNLPIIIVSALGNKEDIVKGLQSGADDYIAKPFYNSEVTERVKAVLRRSGQPKELSSLIFPGIGLSIDLQTQEVSSSGKTIHLTSKEFAVLSLLAKHAPAIVSYDTVAQNVWSEDTPDVRRRIKYLVYLIRRKFEALNPGLEIIQNIDRLGYRLQTELEK